MRKYARLSFASLILGKTLYENNKDAQKKKEQIPVDISFSVGQRTVKRKFIEGTDGLVIDDPKMH